MQVIVDGNVVTYSKLGSGKIIVLLHGWGDSSAGLNDLQTSLAQEYEVIALDLPGFGGSVARAEPYTLQSYAQFVKSFLSKIGVDDVYAFVGHSNGGAILMKGLANNILHADKLILLASAGVRSNYQARKKALRLAAKTLKIPTKVLPKSTQSKLKKKAYAKVGSDLFVAEHMQDTFKNVVEEDIVAESSQVASDTLLIYGSEDEATPVAYGEALSGSIPRSELKIIDGAGHFLHLSHNVQVKSEILEFLQ